MLRDAIAAIDMVSHSIDFASCVTIFLGGGYIALHSRVMPKWVVTCLWYIGLAALFNSITIAVDWTIGEGHPFSHSQIGDVSGSLMNLVLAITVGLLFFHTVWQDYLGSKRRMKEQQDRLDKIVAKRTTKAPVITHKVTRKKRTAGSPAAKKMPARGRVVKSAPVDQDRLSI